MRQLAIAAAALAFTSTAYAAEMPLLKSAPAPPKAAPTWTGLYIGVNGGGAWGTADPDLVVIPNGYFVGINVPAVQSAGRNSFNTSGGLFGGQIGYLMQSGPTIGGLEAGFDWFNAKGSLSTNTLYPTQGCAQAAGCAFNITRNVSSDWLLTFLARVGLDMGTWYPYATAGFAVANVKYSNTFIDNNLGINATTAVSFNKVRGGIAAGGGLEWRWDNRWSLRGEYLYILLNDDDWTSSPPLTSLFPGFPANTVYLHRVSLSESIVRGALSYKLGQ